MDKIVRNIPNFFTLANLLLGCLAIVYLFYDHLYIYDMSNRGVITEMPNIAVACLLLYAAAFIDFMDGFLARVLKAQSEIGKQLDSLADMVTFGLVPGLIMYQLISQAFYASRSSFDLPILLSASAFMLTIFAALRLARFNTAESQPGFIGLASPAMALVVASLPMVVSSDLTGVGRWLQNPTVLIVITAVLSLLMVSSIPLLSLKVKSIKFSEHPWELGGFVSGWAILLLCIFALKIGWLSIPVSFAYYLLLSFAHNVAAKPAQ